ncbi:MAG: helix-turn-helix transcriptional regulator [Candidatus Cloacimonas sp.]|jgi:transcriptional regulator with XRE-family HTH domain|nr:helix-turn-helix transcriptional regulator [Candidatus Cloacimonas sp.]
MTHISKEKMDLLIKRKNEVIKLIEEGYEFEQYNPYLPEADEDDELALYYLNRDIIFLLMDIREAKGLTQAEIATKMGTKQAAISRFEKYNTEPTLEFMFKYARALGVNLHISTTKEYAITLSEADYKRIHHLAARKGMDIKQFAAKAILSELHNGEKYQDLGLTFDSQVPSPAPNYSYERLDEKKVLLEVRS